MKFDIVTYSDAKGDVGIRVWMTGEDKKENEVAMHFTLHTGRASIASCVQEQMRKAFNERIEQIRREAYERGRLAARNKDLRCSKFNGCIDGSTVGW